MMKLIGMLRKMAKADLG